MSNVGDVAVAEKKTKLILNGYLIIQLHGFKMYFSLLYISMKYYFYIINNLSSKSILNVSYRSNISYITYNFHSSLSVAAQFFQGGNTIEMDKSTQRYYY